MHDLEAEGAQKLFWDVLYNVCSIYLTFCFCMHHKFELINCYLIELLKLKKNRYRISDN